LSAQFEQLTGLDLSGVTETFTGLSEAFAGIGDAFADGGISGGIDALVQAFDKLTGVDLSGLTSGVGEFLSEILDVDESTLTSIGGAVESLTGAFSGVDLAGTVSGAATAIGEFFGAFDEVGETVISFVAEIVGQLARDFNDMAPGVAGAAAGVGIFAGGLALMQAFQGIPALLSGISTAFSTLNTVMAANPILLVVSILGGLVAALVTAYNTNEDFRNSVDQLWETLKKGVSDAVEGLKKNVDEIGEAISDAVTKVKENGTEMFNAGRDLIQGLVDGITQKVNAVKETISGAFNKVIDWANGVFDRHSPSKVFAEMGRDLMRGLVVGIDDEAGSVQRTIDGLRFDPPTIRTSRIAVNDSTMGKMSTAAINNAIGLASGSGGNGQPAVVNLVVDGRTLAQVLFDPLRGVAKQKGVPAGAW
jgi:phage-related protein